MALNDVPLLGQSLNQTQNPIRQNFSDVYTGFNVDHASFNDANQGNHKKVTFLPQANNPLPATIANGFVMYDAIPDAGANAAYPITVASNELILLKNGASVAIPLTAADKSTNGWCYLPSGILLKWGQNPMNSGGSSGANTPVVYPVGATIPVFQNVFQIMLGQRFTTGQTSIGSNGFAIFSQTVAGFTVTWSGNNSANTILTYLAIGV